MNSRNSDFPAEFDTALYRDRYSDLSHLSDNDLAAHYVAHGRDEGRHASSIGGPADFFSLISESVNALEIGPFNNPSIKGPQVRYFDTLSTEDLCKRAQHIGIDLLNIPEIHWVDADGDLSVVNELFDCCVTSHAIEHQPDLVQHLVNVTKLLSPGGCYFLAVPDRRYTFDHFLKDSNIAEVIEAHQQRRQRHTLQSVIEHRALTTHNDQVAHWNGLHGEESIDSEKVRSAMTEFNETEGYLDVHAWTFTPSSFCSIITALSSLGLTQLSVKRLYPTLLGSNEFYAILKK